MNTQHVPIPTWPYVTADVPGTGGHIKETHADFCVEEIPTYAPCGEGTHVFFQVEKRGMTTPHAATRIARALQRSPRDVGYAGMKDARALTRQTMSLEHVEPDAVAALQLDGIRIGQVCRHTNKLKLGHLSGNRFELKLRGHGAGSTDRARAVFDRLKTDGIPNYFGPQRFGAAGANGTIGAAVLRGDFDCAVQALLLRAAADEPPAVQRARAHAAAREYAEAAEAWPSGFKEQFKACRSLAQRPGDPRRAWNAIDTRMRRLFVSAAQSAVFNDVLARRISGLGRLLDGDLAWKHANGACFEVPDAAAEQPRCDAFEISPSGPLPGRKMSRPAGQVAEMEDAVLEASGLTAARFDTRESMRLPGARRPLRVPLEAAELSEATDDHGPCLILRFQLPAGSYATALTREIIKPSASV